MGGRDNTNDIVGGRESLGAVHELSDEELHSPRLTVAEMSETWRKTNKRTTWRGQVALANALEILGLANQEVGPQTKEKYTKSMEDSFRSRYNKSAFKPKE
jgi:hypothetical protein